MDKEILRRTIESIVTSETSIDVFCTQHLKYPEQYSFTNLISNVIYKCFEAYDELKDKK